MAIFINGFDFDTSEEAIADHFESIGRVSDVRLVGTGAAVVRFDNPDAASQAVREMDRTTISGNKRYINVKIDGEKGSKGGGKKGRKGDGKDSGYGGGYGGGRKGDYEDRGGKGSGRKGDYEDHTTYAGEMQTGTVAKFLTDRGFGYIKPDDSDNDIFVHFSAIRGGGFRELTEGQRVTFGQEEDPKGKGKGGKQAMRAVAVSVL